MPDIKLHPTPPVPNDIQQDLDTGLVWDLTLLAKTASNDVQMLKRVSPPIVVEGGSPVYNKSGGAVSAFAASGVDEATSIETGFGVVVSVSSGADELTSIEAGGALSVLSASGADADTATETGGAILIEIGSGADVYTPSSPVYSKEGARYPS